MERGDALKEEKVRVYGAPIWRWVWFAIEEGTVAVWGRGAMGCAWWGGRLKQCIIVIFLFKYALFLNPPVLLFFHCSCFRGGKAGGVGGVRAPGRGRRGGGRQQDKQRQRTRCQLHGRSCISNGADRSGDHRRMVRRCSIIVFFGNILKLSYPSFILTG